MLSICIPVYNYYIATLVTQLHQQALSTGCVFEILVIEDASEETYQQKNQLIARLQNVRYLPLQHNQGRVAIRNLLIKEARYEYLLFVDSDMMPPDTHFVARYVTYCNQTGVVCGGMQYNNTPPPPHLYFRWYYGTQRETLSVQQRQLNPYQSFMTNNFMAHRQVFNHVTFAPLPYGYGHEDTIFGFALQNHNISIIHINNPLLHLAQDTFDGFIRKTRQACGNVVYLYSHSDTRHYATAIKVGKYYHFLRKPGLHRLGGWLWKKTHRWLEKKLDTRQPNLFWFDVYKLGACCTYL